jgi:hypothetical protein
LIFFVYPGPRRSEENQFTPLGAGVNKLIFEQWGKILRAMAENEILMLTNSLVHPTDDIIFSFIGEKQKYWKAIMIYMAEIYIGSVGEWNYYNDGKRWLFKMVYRKKTIFWAGVLKGSFRVTFYLGNKAEAVIENSELPSSVKEDFKTAKRYGLIRPLTFLCNSDEDYENIMKVIDIKTKLK